MKLSSDVLYSRLSEDLSPFSFDLRGPVECANNVKEAAARSLFQSFTKKLVSAKTDKTDAAALLKFLDSNTLAREWTLNENTSHDQELIGELKNSIYRFWFEGGEPLVTSYLQILERGSVGGGVALGAEGTSFYSKLFSSPFFVTNPCLYDMYRNYVSHFPVWDEAESNRISTYGEYTVVEGSRLDFVPKNDEISRCICIEPSVNMYYQLGFGQILADRLDRHFGISFKNQQDRNRDIARISSYFNSHVTVDLSSASDSVGLNLCREILPDSLLKILLELRSSHCEIPGLGSFELDIISSMGNGFTFPLQTMIFSAMIEASFRCADRPFKRDGNQKAWGCFGDDLICPSGLIERNLLRLLSLCGFRVNTSKTFTEGPFRESCGADYYLGRNVRGFYMKSLVTPQDFYVVANGLNLFSARTGLYFPRTFDYLKKALRFQPVPMYENMDSGLRVPLEIAKLFGFNPPLDGNGTVLYHADRAIARKIRFTESDIFVPAFLKKKSYIYNGPGAFLCFLQRSLDSCSISVRLDRTSYRRILQRSPCWNYVGSTPSYDGLEWRRLEDAVYINLSG